MTAHDGTYTTIDESNTVFTIDNLSVVDGLPPQWLWLIAIAVVVIIIVVILLYLFLRRRGKAK